MFESEEIFHLKIKVKELEEELEKAENEIDYYEQKATEVEKSIAKPSPSAGAVPEVTVEWSGDDGNGCDTEGTVSVGCFELGVFDPDAAERLTTELRIALRYLWPKPHAAAGGEAITRLANEKIWLEDTLADALAAGLAACQERDAEIERLRKALEAEREKTSEYQAVEVRQTPGPRTENATATSSRAEAPRSPAPTPAPCPTCKGDGELKMSVGAYKRCADCSGTGRAPASSPAPAAPEAKTSGLTHEEIGVACANIGVDLTCGQCASVFYTGSGSYPHTCKQATAAPEARGEETRSRVEAFIREHSPTLQLGDPSDALLALVRAERTLARDAALVEAEKACECPFSAARVRALRGKVESK